MLDAAAQSDRQGIRELSRETRLLLACARVSMDAATSAQVGPLLEEGIDWQQVHRIAPQHGMVPLLYWHLNRLAPARIPARHLRAMQVDFLQNTHQNLMLIEELHALLDLFQARGISVVPFKGVMLVASVYGCVSLRKSGDLDILVHPRDIREAGEVMLARGYRSDGPAHDHTFEQRFAGDGGMAVELRWRLSPWHFRSVLDLDTLRGRCTSVDVSGRMVPSLSPEDLLVYLCMHGTKHYWTRLFWLCDVAELVRAHPEMEWERAQESARVLGSRRMLDLGLFLAGDLLGANVPARVFQRLQRDSRIRLLAQQVSGYLFDSPDGPREPASRRERSAYQLSVTDRLADRVCFCRVKAGSYLRPNQLDRAWVKLPSSLGFLYYILRPLRLAAGYGSSRIHSHGKR